MPDDFRDSCREAQRPLPTWDASQTQTNFCNGCCPNKRGDASQKQSAMLHVICWPSFISGFLPNSCEHHRRSFAERSRAASGKSDCEDQAGFVLS